MIGFPAELFLETVSDLFKCSICFGVMRNPKQCPQGHVYCADCINEKLKTSSACPECNLALTSANLGTLLVVQNLISSLEVRCPTRLATIQAAEPESQAPSERSCAWTGTVTTLDEHLAQCLHAAVACPNTECKAEMKRLEAGIHDARCPYKLVDCPLLCNQPANVESHCSECCPRRLVDCTNACGERILFQDAGSHSTSCPLQEVNCPYFLAFACHETCTGRLRRMEIEDHIENKKTMASVITQMTSALAALQSNAPAAAANASAVNPGARQVAYGKRKRRSDMISATSDAVIASRLRVVSLIEEIVDPTIIDDASKANLIAWCNQASLKTLATIQHQLLQAKPVEHQPWSTHHLALEIPYTTCPGIGFDISSTTVDLGDGVRMRLTLEFLANTKQCGRKTNCFVDLEGFRGSANFMVDIVYWSECCGKLFLHILCMFACNT